MKLSPEQLEKLIHQNLRALPDRRAPRSLESRVLAAIEARAALPWWQQSFRAWPVAARAAFLLVSAALLFAVVRLVPGFDGSSYVSEATARMTWLGQLRALGSSLAELGALIARAIPPMWIYAILGGLATLYVTLFGLGATAYRMLYANHR